MKRGEGQRQVVKPIFIETSLSGKELKKFSRDICRLSAMMPIPVMVQKNTTSKLQELNLKSNPTVILNAMATLLSRLGAIKGYNMKVGCTIPEQMFLSISSMKPNTFGLTCPICEAHLKSHIVYTVNESPRTHIILTHIVSSCPSNHFQLNIAGGNE